MVLRNVTFIFVLKTDLALGIHLCHVGFNNIYETYKEHLPRLKTTMCGADKVISRVVFEPTTFSAAVTLNTTPLVPISDLT